MVKIFIIGWIILLGAIVINVWAAALKVDTWYDFAKSIQSHGLKKAFTKTDPASLIFLFVAYPLLLGVICYACLRVLKLC